MTMVVLIKSPEYFEQSSREGDYLWGEYSV
jgi:hypothetical protein